MNGRGPEPKPRAALVETLPDAVPVEESIVIAFL
jgi:hypothetical protein